MSFDAAHFVRDSAVQTEPTVWVPVIAEQKFALQERRYITGKNRVFPAKMARERSFLPDVLWVVFSAKIKKSAGVQWGKCLQLVSLQMPF